MRTPNVVVTREGTVAVLRLARPPVNAIELELARELGEVFGTIAHDESVGAVVITGSGRSFSAGVDLKVVPTYGPAEQREMVATINRIILAAYEAPLPLVAAINGHAIAGGLVIALACDYRIATDAVEARFGLTEARAGIPFPFAAMTVVTAELSPQTARIATLLARNCGAREALALGVVDQLESPERVVECATALARDLAAGAPRETYARVKLQLRAEPLARIRDAVARGADPFLDSWLGSETPAAAARLLR